MLKEKGITLIALSVTIIVMLILAGVTITGTIKGIDESQENKLLSELRMVQHAIVERDTKYKLTKNDDLLVGEIVNFSELTDEVNWEVTSAEDEINYKSYHLLNKDALKNLGLESGAGSYNDEYIVNYYTHEVYNQTTPKTPSGELLYASFNN